MPNYRLVAYGYGGRGALDLSGVYGELDEAVTVGERLFVALEHKPHLRPFRIDVVDVWTRETVSRLVPNVDRDPAVCAACGAPRDPFAAGKGGA